MKAGNYLKEIFKSRFATPFLILVISLMYKLSLAKFTVPTFYQTRDIMRSEVWWQQPILHGPEFTYGGFVPGPLYYVLTSIPLALGGNWWHLTIIRLTLIAFSALLVWLLVKKYWGELPALWAWSLFLNSHIILRNSIPDWNASYQAIFSLTSLSLLFFTWTGSTRSTRIRWWLAYCLISSLGCQIHFSMVYFILLGVFVQICGPHLKVQRIDRKYFFIGLLIYILPLFPFFFWWIKSGHSISIAPSLKKIFSYASVHAPLSNSEGHDSISAFLYILLRQFFLNDFFFLFSLTVALANSAILSISKIKIRTNRLDLPSHLLISSLCFLIATGFLFVFYPTLNRYIFHMQIFILVSTALYCDHTSDLVFKLNPKFLGASSLIGSLVLFATGFQRIFPINSSVAFLKIVYVLVYLTFFLGVLWALRTNKIGRLSFRTIIMGASGLSLFNLNLMLRKDFEGYARWESGLKSSSHISARAIDWACKKIVQDTGWDMDTVLERISTLGIHPSIDLGEVCRSSRSFGRLTEKREVPSGYFLFKQRSEFYTSGPDTIGKWILQQRLPIEVHQLLESGGMSLGPPISSNGVILISYQIKDLNSSIYHFHNRALSRSKNAYQELLYSTEIHSGNLYEILNLDRTKYLIVLDYCKYSGISSCRAGIFIDLMDERTWYLNFIGSPLNVNHPSLSPILVQWRGIQLISQCGDGLEILVTTISKIGKIDRSQNGDFFMTPMETFVTPPCRGQPKKLRVKISETEIFSNSGPSFKYFQNSQVTIKL